MRPWLSFKDLFSFQPSSFSTTPPLLSEIYKELMIEGPSFSSGKAQLDNIKFDNSMRIGISLLALLVSFALWAGKVIPTVGPVVMIFLAYVVVQVSLAIFLTRSTRYRQVNFALCSIDIIALSWGVYWTGGTSSPLYFVYFMPLIIQAFHRDWAMLVYYGVAGMVFYSVATAFSVPNWTAQAVVGLGTRLFFMTMTVGIALLAVTLLRKKEFAEKRRMSRLKCLVYLSQLLNGVTLAKELPRAVEDFVKILNLELQDPHKGWARIFLVQNGNPLMTVVQDPLRPHPELKQSIASHACPAMQGNRTFQIRNADTETSCPVESFSMFKSHICMPISGEMNEGFGVVFAASSEVDAFNEEDMQFLQFIGRSIGLSIQRLKRMDELNLAFEMDSCAMATFMGSTRTLEDTYAAIVDGARTILDADSVSLLLWEPTKSRLETRWAVGLKGGEAQGFVYQIGEGIPGKVFETGNPFWTYDLDNHPHYRSGAPFKGVLALPLQNLRGDSVGVIMAFITDGHRTFSVEEIDLVSTFCTRAVVALENAALHLKERKISSDLQEINDAPTEEKAA